MIHMLDGNYNIYKNVNNLIFLSQRVKLFIRVIGIIWGNINMNVKKKFTAVEKKSIVNAVLVNMDHGYQGRGILK